MAKIDYIIDKHIKRLGIKECQDSMGIYNQLAKKYGSSKAENLMNSLWGATNYDVLYSEYDIAMIYAGAYDYHVLRKFYEWIYNNKEKFGNTILEVGCGCGFITSFLAAVFPDKQIVSIDRAKNALEIAKRTVKKCGLKNVVFQECTIEELEPNSFDTVFSARTMMENDQYNIEESTLSDIDASAGFSGCSDYSFPGLCNYITALKRLIKDNGNLISIETTDYYMPGFYAMLRAMSECGFAMNMDTYANIVTARVDDYAGFQAAEYKLTGKRKEFNLENYVSLVSDYINLETLNYNGWHAQIMKEYLSGEVIAEYTNLVGCHVLSYNKFNETQIVDFYYNNGTTNATLNISDISNKEMLIEQTQKEIEEANSNFNF